MPGFTIHLAIGKRYYEKHKGQIEDNENFIRGIIEPDLYTNINEREQYKTKSHYANFKNNHRYIDIGKFLEDKKVDIENDYWKGYFMHLLTDYYFYSIDFKEECKKSKSNNEKFYHDYDCLNKQLISKYKTDVYNIKPIEKTMNIINEEPKYLEYKKVVEFIEKIYKQIEIIKENGMEGLK